MTAFDEYDAFVAQPYTPVDWYDYANEGALPVLARFDAADWDALSAAWSTRSPDWVFRMVYTLRRAERARVAPLLRALVPACDDDVLEVAVDVLRRFDGAALREALDATAVATLRGLERRTSRPDVIEALLARRAALDP